MHHYRTSLSIGGRSVAILTPRLSPYSRTPTRTALSTQSRPLTAVDPPQQPPRYGNRFDDDCEPHQPTAASHASDALLVLRAPV